MELEAHYFTNAQDTLTLTQRSSRPFETLKGGIPLFGIDKHIPNAIDKCIKEFSRFCNELESQVEWVRDLVTKSGSETLYEALWWRKEDDEVEMMFGPITDEELEDEGSEDAILRRLSNEEDIKRNLSYEGIEDEDEGDD